MKRTIMMTLAWLVLGALLTGCVAAVVAAGAATTSLIVYDRRSVVVIERDTRIFHLIHKALASDSRYRGSHIEVSVFNQSVLLVGETPIASLRVLAEKIAQSTPYVRRVYNEITIAHPTELVLRSKDAWITGEVRTKLLTEKGLQSGCIRVVTENGVVYLSGIVSRAQSNIAVNVTRQVKGVRKVVKVFQYIR